MRNVVKFFVIICLIFQANFVLAAGRSIGVGLTIGSFCGDGTVNAGEECDDGNNVDGDGCSSSCVSEYCGDAIVNNHEACDGNISVCTISGYDGNRLCNATCDGWNVCIPSESCGDGIVNGNEVCDDGNTDNCDGCRGDCTRLDNICGDGYLDCGEECDGNIGLTTGKICTSNCLQTNAPASSGSASFFYAALDIIDIYPRIASTEVVVNWKTNRDAECIFFWGDSQEVLDVQQQELVRSQEHRAIVDDLEPDQKYYYRIECQDVWGHKAYSETKTLVTKEEVDRTPPTSVDNFQATVSGIEVRLSWTNPHDQDLQGVKIVRSSEYYPKDIAGGKIVYDGKAGSTIDYDVAPGTTYFYSAFSYDDNGNVSAPAIVSINIPKNAVLPEEIKKEPETRIPEQDSETKIVAKPEEKKDEKPTNENNSPVSGINIADLSALINKKVEAEIKDGGEIKLLPQSLLTLDLLPEKIIAKPEEYLIVSVVPENESEAIVKNYLLQGKDDGGLSASISSPAQPGNYFLYLTSVDEKGVILSKTKISLKVDDYGVVEGVWLFGFGAKPISNAKVYVEQLVDGVYRRWPAEKFYQNNPIYTDGAGKYGFVVMNGEYRLVFEADHFISSSETIKIDSNILNLSITLQRESVFDLLKSVDWMYYVSVIAVIAGFMFLRMKFKKK